jgi:hypothetical protein
VASAQQTRAAGLRTYLNQLPLPPALELARKQLRHTSKAGVAKFGESVPDFVCAWQGRGLSGRRRTVKAD